jgi:hypothetical protein
MTGTCIRWCQICFNRPATSGVRCDDCSMGRNPTARAYPRIKHARAALNADPSPESGP